MHGMEKYNKQVLCVFTFFHDVFFFLFLMHYFQWMYDINICDGGGVGNIK